MRDTAKKCQRTKVCIIIILNRFKNTIFSTFKFMDHDYFIQEREVKIVEGVKMRMTAKNENLFSRTTDKNTLRLISLLLYHGFGVAN